jgi:hypothetical protein
MWAEAWKLESPVRRALDAGHQIEHLSDLTDEERRQCLLRVHEYIAKHRVLQLQHRGTVERGKGPSFDAQLCDPCFEYNGDGPTSGRNVKWYRKAVFQDQLRRFGWTAVRCKTAQQVFESVTARQCMLALQATNAALVRCSQATGYL